MQQIPVCTRRLGTLAIVEPDNAMVARIEPRQPRGDPQDLRPAVGLLRPRQPRPLDAEPGDGARDGRQWRAAGRLQRRPGPGQDRRLFPRARHRLDQQELGRRRRRRRPRRRDRRPVRRQRPAASSAALAGGINVKKGEANVTLSIVNARTTEEEALVEGYSRKSDLSWAAGGGAGWWGGFGAAGATGYQNTEIGQVIVLAYLDAYTKLVTQLGGLPANASAAAPVAH